MLTKELQQDILATAQKYWAMEVATSAFQRLATGREIGHRIADDVEEKTTNLLEKHFDHAHQQSARGGRRARGMGDIWIKCAGIYSPINIKSGEINANGQPNMVSLAKLMRALAQREIDSYYLLFIKIGTERSGRVDSQLYIADILDYLEYTSFDSGPGQIMLHERDFFTHLDSNGNVQSRTVKEKLQYLHEMLVNADRRLLVNRKIRQSSFKRLVNEFEESRTIDQSNLGLQ